MEYISLTEASKLSKKSISTIKRFVKANKDKDIFKYEQLPTGHKKVYVLKSEVIKYFSSSGELFNDLLDEPLNEPLNEPLKQEAKTDDLSNDIQGEYIQHLKDTIEFLKSENKDLHEEFKNFQVIEQQAIERIKEQNHIIMQLQSVAEERQQKLNAYLNKNNNKQETYNVNIDEAQIIENEDEVIEEQEQPQQEPTTFSDYLNKFKTPPRV